jgi:hypothetical protein
MNVTEGFELQSGTPDTTNAKQPQKSGGCDRLAAVVQARYFGG